MSGNSAFRKHWLVRGLSSSVGQKLVMGATGLLLCGFLVVHLAGNLLMYKGAQHYNDYAAALHSNELLPLAEAGLFVLFILHIILAFSTTRLNTSARSVGYTVKETKQSSDPGLWRIRPQSTMFLTGAIVLGFLILHLIDMRFADWSRNLAAFSSRFHFPESENPFEHAIRVLKDPISAGVYVIGSLFLGYHLSHGFQSAFRSLGFAHPKYTPILKSLSILFGVVIAIGFASLPIMFFIGMK